MANRIQIMSAVPTFLVSDVGETAQWYVKRLGFEIQGHFPDEEPYVYASIQLNGAEIMLLSLSGYHKPDLTALRPAGLWDAYLRMSGVDEFYRRLRNEPFIKTAIKKQPYGDWEFEVRDPNGYTLAFGGAE